MDEYERIADTIIAMFQAGDRAGTMTEIGRLSRPDALIVVVMMANRMTADYREQFTGFLAALAMTIRTDSDTWNALATKTYPGA